MLCRACLPSAPSRELERAWPSGSWSGLGGGGPQEAEKAGGPPLLGISEDSGRGGTHSPARATDACDE